MNQAQNPTYVHVATVFETHTPGNNTGIVSWTPGMSQHSRCENHNYVKYMYVLHAILVLSPFLFVNTRVALGLLNDVPLPYL